MSDDLFNNICLELNLGCLTRMPEKLSGGFMHKIYRVQTSLGDYAIKLLNPEVMKRSDVFDNYNIAEQLEEKLLNAEIPIVPALKFNNKKMQCISGQYFYVFEFIDGKALNSNKIELEHCKCIGELLAKIHKIELSNKSITKCKINIDWDYYINLAKSQAIEIVEMLQQHKKLLIESQAKGNESYERLPVISSISNGDLDVKNVLWVNNKPFVIDLECLKYGNPFLELLELALCWSGYEHCNINYKYIEQFISSYFAIFGMCKIDWSVLYYSNNGRLKWLEYNVKRALRIECNEEEERLLGIEQVKDTIQHIIYYNIIGEELINRLSRLF
ncbi:MAG: phosphotransferase [Oscillospiraceae bacterium]|nr:phosphotransferase [Oscillospiraceae bacterium]